MGPRKYQQKYCAYIDILGFRGIVKNLKDTHTFETLKALLKKIQKPLEIDSPSPKAWDTEFSVQSISDALAISSLVEDTGLLQILYAIELLTVELLREGYFVRGALVKGLLYHDPDMVFGEALVKAYELETTIVRYPRVTVTRDVLKDIESYAARYPAPNNPYAGRILQAADGPHYVHVLGKLIGRMNDVYVRNINTPPEKRQSLDEFLKFPMMIMQRMDEAMDNPKHFEKVVWFGNYWNSHYPALVVGTPGEQGLFIPPS